VRVQYVGAIRHDDVACRHDLLLQQEDDEVAARMRGSEVTQLELYAINCHLFLCLRRDLVRQSGHLPFRAYRSQVNSDFPGLLQLFRTMLGLDPKPFRS
jgi:hypothetical protein